MSVSFSVRPYGTVNEQPPYNASATGNLPSVEATYTASQRGLASFPSATVNVWPISPGVLMNGVYCYSVIEVPATGLQQYSKKYVAKELVTTIATLRG
jgi:hypothetical protein